MWVFLIAIGLVFGVVVNSLADNLPPDAHDVRHPPRRPRCRNCGQAHRGPFVMALVGLLFRRGRCEHCSAPRPWRSVIVEVSAGAALALAWFWAGQAGAGRLEFAERFVSAAAVLLIFLLVVVIDVEHRLILWSVVWPAALALALAGVVLPDHGVVKTLVGGAAGYVIVLAVFLLAELLARVLHRIRGQPLTEVAFGGGDVNLAGLVGLAVGWPGVLLALMITIAAGGLYSLGFILVQLARRRYVPYSALPYGPFLVLGGLVIFFFGQEISTRWPPGQP